MQALRPRGIAGQSRRDTNSLRETLVSVEQDTSMFPFPADKGRRVLPVSIVDVLCFSSLVSLFFAIFDKKSSFQEKTIPFPSTISPCTKSIYAPPARPSPSLFPGQHHPPYPPWRSRGLYRFACGSQPGARACGLRRGRLLCAVAWRGAHTG